jgi:copper resistance protein B
VEYDLLLTNWVMLQPAIELEFHGKADPARGMGTGLTSTNMGVRLRYEIRREVAPYLGVTWHRRYGGTAQAARARGGAASGAELVVGLRTWF